MAAFESARASLVDALQMEYFCDDLSPPDDAFGWATSDYVEFYKSGGQTLPAARALPPLPAAAPPAAAPAAPLPAAPPPPFSGDSGDPALNLFLEDAEFGHLCKAMASITWDECDVLYKEGRPRLITRLGKLGISLSDRQKFATLFGKASKPEVKAGQAGGGRPQAAPFAVAPMDEPGRPQVDLQTDLAGYQAQILRDGIPPRLSGLFPENDPLLELLDKTGWKPCTKGLPHPTVDGGVEFAVAENGWVSGENAIEHGMDLRWFIKPDPSDHTLHAAVRFSENAMIGRGVPGTSIHGGACESCLDEATAELAKSKLFPLATTAKIEFRILKPVLPHVTYGVRCWVKEVNVKGVSYDIAGELTDATDDKVVYVACVAKMANPSAL